MCEFFFVFCDKWLYMFLLKFFICFKEFKMEKYYFIILFYCFSVLYERRKWYYFIFSVVILYNENLFCRCYGFIISFFEFFIKLFRIYIWVRFFFNLLYVFFISLIEEVFYFNTFVCGNVNVRNIRVDEYFYLICL